MSKNSLIAVVASFFLVASPSFAQEAPSISTNANVETMLGKTNQVGTMVELRGYVGPSAPEVVRLYWDLSLTRYWDIPRSSITQQIMGADPLNDPVRLFVSSTTLITTASAMPADAVAIQRALIEGRFGNIFTGSPPIPVENNMFGKPQFASNSALHGALTGFHYGQALSCIAGIPVSCLYMMGEGVGSSLGSAFP